MPSERRSDFPLFPLPIVLLPTEAVPLHIFEERYKVMISQCLSGHDEFGIIWLSDEGLRDVGCTAQIVEVLDEQEDGRMNVLVRGVKPFRLIERAEDHEFPTGTVDLLDDRSEEVQPTVAEQAQQSYSELVEKATDKRPDEQSLKQASSYELAATVDIGPEVKQGLLELRSEQARLRMLTRMFKDGMKRLEIARRIAERAQGNGKIN